MSYRRRAGARGFRSIVALLGITAALFGMVAFASPGLFARSGSALPVASHDARINFPAGHYPALTLAPGRVEAVHSLLNIASPMRFGDFVWDDDHVPTGDAWVRIDLARQTLSVFRAGQEIGSTVILYGTDGKPTPTGVFSILERATHHRSTTYDAEMPFMLRLTKDGVAIHASNVRMGFATHGCIGVPPGFARLLFSQMKRGDLVAILPG